jgi:hypothetical protein
MLISDNHGSLLFKNIPEDEQKVLNEALSKGVRYQNALIAIQKNEIINTYMKAKAQFKITTQNCLRNGVEVEDIKKALSQLNITRDINEKLFDNLVAKIVRYQKKLGKSDRTTLATLDQFLEVAKQIKETSLAVSDNEESHALYREFRIAKKGLKDDPTGYVGFFKYLKKNSQLIRKHGKILKEMCSESKKITLPKVFRKIEKAANLKDKQKPSS